MIVAVLLAGLLLQGTQANSSFDERLKAATGPRQLRELESWCAKNSLPDERKQVQELLKKIALPPKPSPAREAARAQGDQAREAVENFRTGRARSVADEVRKVVAWMKTESFAPADGRDRVGLLVRGLLLEEPAERKALEAELKALTHVDRPADEAKKASAALDGQVKAILKKFTGQILAAVEKCLAAGEPGYAFDLYRFLLQVDPDNERARRGLGEAKVDGRWLRPFEVEQFRLGLLWDDKGGWVPIKSRDRIEAGDLYDPATRQWAPAAELNRTHSDPANPWRLESEHFQLVSTADLELNARLLARMEAYFLQAFRQYDLFFAGKNSAKGASLIFGMAPAKKRLLVNFYRDQAQFRDHANPPTAWAAGFYSGGKHASFFYGRPNDFNVGLMQHELTHQILGENSDGGGAPSWLAEGAAVYLQYAEFRGGTLSLGDLKDNGRVAEYRKNLRAGKPEHSLKTMVETFTTFQSWDSGDIAKNYRGAGATVYFLMTFDGGRYRADTIQLLRDAYFSKPRPLEEYYDITVAGLDFLMARFYKECDVP